VDAHGDRCERRVLQASGALSGYSDWPHLGQVFRVDRWVTVRGQTTHEVAYGVTDLRAWAADGQELLGYVRGHWGIENRLHWVRDVTWGEDRSTVRSGQGPEVMAALRNTAIAVLRLAGAENLAARTRSLAAHAEQTLPLIGIRFLRE
jgi:hypothetical protein